MLNLFVSIVVLGMIAFILFWFFKKPQEDAKRAQQKKWLSRNSSGSHGGDTLQELLSSKNRNQLVLFLIEKILHLAWNKSFFLTLECMQIYLWETNMWLKSLLKKQVSMVSLVA